MKLITFLLIIFTSPAMARVAPGQPPWSCSVLTVCDSKSLCLRLPNAPLYFDLLDTAGLKNTFVTEGLHGRQQVARIFPSVEDATAFLANKNLEKRFEFVLVRTNEVSDAHSFRLYDVVTRGTGERFISENNLLVACSSR